ncbi:conserved hypothetical protein [Neospora caninum Liverpool]|uniref:Transmembrane protein n=1 Tax=Neospora caninum (strain Liverpool) TaxID=572307 RepID=F0VEH7_NEOCL|nr:conserved hypothetical protein [Neospora caninum Liverpool]CBZ52121.1 conserved hypothetical protein [Neospora caninum Liverpool]CEL66083.1 TPA: hypothetical protein BN1204_019100 [Neospora caninum Liverpool]|eukprot:XP_003882153.1 conserved hypothetical protein [Neospora caninum Liverpool]
MAKDKRGTSAKKTTSESSGAPLSSGFASVILPSSLLHEALAAEAYPFGVVVTTSPVSSGGSPSLPVVLLPPASPLSSDAKNALVKTDFFSFHRSLASSAAASPSDLLSRRLPRQANLALQHLPGGCSIRGLWLRVPPDQLEEISRNFPSTFSLPALAAAFSSLPGPAFMVVLLLPVGNEGDRPSQDSASCVSAPPRCLVFSAAGNALPASPVSVPVTLSLAAPSPLRAYVSVLPLRVEVSFSPSELSAAASLKPENVAGFLASELSLALEECFDGPLLYVEAPVGHRGDACSEAATGTGSAVVISDKHASLPPSSCRLAYLQPLLSSRAPLRFALSASSCSRLPSLAVASALHSPPEEVRARAHDTTQIVAIDGNFVAAALEPLSSPSPSLASSASLASSSLAGVCSALRTDLAVSLSRRLVQSLSDAAGASDETGGTGGADLHALAPRAFARRQFFWKDVSNRVLLGNGLSATETGDPTTASETGRRVDVPLLLSDVNSPAAEGEEEDDLEVARDTFGFLLGVPNPVLERELADGVFPPSLVSATQGFDGVHGRGAGRANNVNSRSAKELCHRDEFWATLEAKMGGKADKGRGKSASKGGGECTKTATFLTAVLGAVVVFVAAALLFFPKLAAQKRAQEDL